MTEMPKLDEGETGALCKCGHRSGFHAWGGRDYCYGLTRGCDCKRFQPAKEPESR